MLSTEIYDRVLAKLDVPRTHPSWDILLLLYRRWCQRVGFDNVTKRLALHSTISASLPFFLPEDFLEHWLRTGCSGTCWPAAEGLYGVLKYCGFDVSRAMGRIAGGNGPPDHGTVILKFDGRAFLLDPAILTNRPLAMERRKVTQSRWSADRASHNGEDTVEWVAPFVQQKRWLRLKVFDCTREQFQERYENARVQSHFNDETFIQRNRTWGTLIYAQGQLAACFSPRLQARWRLPQDKFNRLLGTAFGIDQKLLSSLATFDATCRVRQVDLPET